MRACLLYPAYFRTQKIRVHSITCSAAQLRVVSSVELCLATVAFEFWVLSFVLFLIFLAFPLEEVFKELEAIVEEDQELTESTRTFSSSTPLEKLYNVVIIQCGGRFLCLPIWSFHFLWFFYRAKRTIPQYLRLSLLMKKASFHLDACWLEDYVNSLARSGGGVAS